MLLGVSFVTIKRRCQGSKPGEKPGMNKSNLHKVAIQNRKDRDKHRRRQEIIEAAKNVLLSKGYLNATMDDIALEAGISKITIYRHFGGKDNLCYSVMVPDIDALTELLEAVEKNLSDGKYTSGVQLVRDLFQAFYQFYLISPNTFRLIQFFQQTGAVWNLDDDLRWSLNEKGKHNARTGRAIYQAAADRGFIKNVEIHDLQDVLYGAIIGIIQFSEIKSHRTGVGSDNEAMEEQLPRRLRMLEQIIIESIVSK